MHQLPAPYLATSKRKYELSYGGLVAKPSVEWLPGDPSLHTDDEAYVPLMVTVCQGFSTRMAGTHGSR